MKLALLFIALTLPLSFAQAGGTVERDALSELMKSNAALVPVLESLELAEVGTSTRLGRHSLLSGARVSPFTFEARVKGSGAKDFPLKVILHADWEIVGPSGKVYDPFPVTPPTEGRLKILQELVKIEIVPSDSRANKSDSVRP